MASATLTPYMSRIKAALELRTSSGETITVRKFLARWLSHFWLKCRVWMATRSRWARCPACGIRRKHKIKWDADVRTRDGKIGRLLHICAICTAPWSEAPVFDFKTWQVAGPLEEFDPPPNHTEAPPLEVLG